MSEIEIIKLTFGIMLSLGSIVLFVLTYLLGYKYMVQEKRCTSKTTGVVRRYTMASRGNGVFLPVVFYRVNGKEYKVVGPEYKWYVTKTRKSLLEQNTMEFDVKGQVLYTNRRVNAAVGIYRNPIRELYPLSKELDVYYDPNNPKLAYVLRYCNKKFMFYSLLFAAIGILVVDLLILLIL